MERRVFIIAAVAGGAGLLEYGAINRWMGDLHHTTRPFVSEYERFGARAALEAITPNEEFYVTSKGLTPRIDPATWRLEFDGLVEHLFALTYRELRELPRVERTLTLECIDNTIGGNTIGNARWAGAALKPLLERAKPRPEAVSAAIYGADGLSSGHPLDRLWRDENFIAYEMNGVDLPPNHGYPARLFVPGKWGMKQPKWITRIECRNAPYTGYWEKIGWSDRGDRAAHARFTQIEEGQTLKAAAGKPIELTGYALGTIDGIAGVELSFDSGQTWRTTEILSNPSPLVWTFWRYRWANALPGTYRLRARALDGLGKPEPFGPQGTFPDGATGQEVLKVHVLEG